MGKKRGVSIRRLAERLIQTHPNMFTEDFEENRRLISEVVDFPSKALRNKVAGYILRLKKRESTPALPTITGASAYHTPRRRRRRR